jgi:hypothetical protein
MDGLRVTHSTHWQPIGCGFFCDLIIGITSLENGTSASGIQ